MIFSKLGRDNLPLWWLVFLKEKVVTRRPPPCLHCGKKWWEHLEVIFGDSEGKMACPMEGGTQPRTYYESDLSRWQPYNTCTNSGCALREGHRGCHSMQETSDIYKSIAIQPRRCSAAICKNCGGWKEWHGKDKGDNIVKAGYWRGWDMTQPPRKRTQFGFEPTGDYHLICDHYEPLKVKIKSVMMESEWWHNYVADKGGEKLIDFEMTGNAYIGTDEDREKLKGHLKAEATREGFGGDWQKLQEALSMYPKGTPLARIELEAHS